MVTSSTLRSDGVDLVQVVDDVGRLKQLDARVRVDQKRHLPTTRAAKPGTSAPHPPPHASPHRCRSDAAVPCAVPPATHPYTHSQHAERCVRCGTSSGRSEWRQRVRACDTSMCRGDARSWNCMRVVRSSQVECRHEHTWNCTPVRCTRRSRLAEPRAVGTTTCGKQRAQSFSRTGRTNGEAS